MVCLVSFAAVIRVVTHIQVNRIGLAGCGMKLKINKGYGLLVRYIDDENIAEVRYIDEQKTGY